MWLSSSALPIQIPDLKSSAPEVGELESGPRHSIPAPRIEIPETKSSIQTLEISSPPWNPRLQHLGDRAWSPNLDSRPSNSAPQAQMSSNPEVRGQASGFRPPTQTSDLRPTIPEAHELKSRSQASIPVPRTPPPKPKSSNPEVQILKSCSKPFESRSSNSVLRPESLSPEVRGQVSGFRQPIQMSDLKSTIPGACELKSRPQPSIPDSLTQVSASSPRLQKPAGSSLVAQVFGFRPESSDHRPQALDFRSPQAQVDSELRFQTFELKSLPRIRDSRKPRAQVDPKPDSRLSNSDLRLDSPTPEDQGIEPPQVAVSDRQFR